MDNKSSKPAELSSNDPVVEGWKLVPMEPTSNQMNEGADAMREAMVMFNSGRSVQYASKKVYDAMLSSAPTPPNTPVQQRAYIFFLHGDDDGGSSVTWSGTSFDSAIEAWKELGPHLDITGLWAGVVASRNELKNRFGQEAPKGTFSCPICGKETPHQHPADMVLDMRETQIHCAKEAEERWQKILARASEIEAMYPARTPLSTSPLLDKNDQAEGERLEWSDYEKIRDFREVDFVINNFHLNCTADNATEMVKAIVENTRNYPQPPVQEVMLSASKDAPDSNELVEALKASVVAIDDWLNLYASDMCDEQRVIEARNRVNENGTLYYIATVQQRNRAALAQSPSVGPNQMPFKQWKGTKNDRT